MTTSNIDEVNRLLAEKDSSSEEDDDLASLTGGQDRNLESLLGSSQFGAMMTAQNNRQSAALPSKMTAFMSNSAATQRPTSQNLASSMRMPMTFKSNMKAEEILNAVSSDSDEDDKEVQKMAAQHAQTFQIPAEEKKQVMGIPTVPKDAPSMNTMALSRSSDGAANTEYDYYMANMKDPSVREKFYNKQLNLDSSSDDEEPDEASGPTRQHQLPTKVTTTAATSKSKSKAASELRQVIPEPERLSSVEIVELNERQSQHSSDKKIEEANQLLSFDKEFYNVKKELFSYSQFQTISRNLYEEDSHAYYGVVSCVRMFRAKNGTVIFVGNSTGYIRVFDIQTQRQMKPLYDDTRFQDKVLSIDISEDGHYLLAGYKSGTLILWDSAKYKKAHVMNDVAAKGPASSDFSMVKILFITEQNVVAIVTAEESGRIRLVHVTKTFLGGFSHKANSLYEKDLIGTATISVQRCVNLPSHYSPFCDVSCLAAFGATNKIAIVEMKSWPPRPLKTIERPPICKEKSVPLIDWGYGLTPCERERTMPLMAIAWDKVVQLLYVNDDTRTLEFDGFYCSDQVINQVYFMADSVLVIIVNQEEIKVLYTEKFKPGNVAMLAPIKSSQDLLASSDFKATVEATKGSELETGHHLQDIKPGLVAYTVERPSDGALVEHKIMTFNNTMCQFKKNIIFLGQNSITRARMFSWREFIDKLKFTDNQDWLTVLKVALEIYNGEIKGFALLPDAKDRRQQFLKDYMKKLILTSIQTVIFKFKSSDGMASQSDSTHNDSDDSYEDNFSIDKIAIKVSIEFCLQIQEVDYLFGEIYRFFVEKDLEDKFISHLCVPIIAGQFRNEFIPEYILQKLVRLYEDRQDFKILEKIILNINIESYQKKRGDINSENSSNPIVAASQTKGVRAYLEVVCKSHCMVSALIQLQTSDRSQHVREGCTQILSMLLNNMETQKALAEEEERKRGSSAATTAMTRRVTRQDIHLLKSADKNRKYEVEQSSFYIGYKLLWILSLFLKGKKFPSGELNEVQFQAHTFNIIDFVTNEQTLAQLLDFDAEAFFQTVERLFSGKPWNYLVNQSNKYVFEFKKQPPQQTASGLQSPYGGSASQPVISFEQGADIGAKILTIFKKAAERTNRQEPELTQTCFSELILRIIVNQENDYQETLPLDSKARTKPATDFTTVPAAPTSVLYGTKFTKISIGYEWITTALHKAIARYMVESETKKNSKHRQMDQQLIIDSLRATKLKIEDIDRMIREVQKPTEVNMSRIKIQLFEQKEDYLEAFMLHLTNEALKKQIFKWLLDTFEKLTRHDNDLRQQYNKKVTMAANKKKSAAKMSFGNNKKKEGLTERERLLVDSSSSDDEGTKGNEPEDVPSIEEYAPLTKLKTTVKNRILDLAQHNSEQTVKLVETYLSDGDFQERLILERFGRFEDAQLKYLISYITNNEDTIKMTMRESYTPQNQAAAVKYEQYLVLFTRLLCKPKTVQGKVVKANEIIVEQWVSKSYFPPDKCLPICKEFGNLRGEAILTTRSGKPIEAIDVYLKILSEYPVYKMLAQFNLLRKDRPSFLGYTDQEEDEVKFAAGGRTSSMVPSSKEHTRFIPDSIIEFDAILGKACSICQTNDLDGEQRMKAWFQILRYLQNFMVESHTKVVNGLATARSEYKSLEHANLSEELRDQYKKRLKDFVMDRINYILRYPGLDIPLKMIVEQLNMTFEQIKSLCGSKLRHNGTTLRIENCAQLIAVDQLFDLFTEVNERMGAGFVVEPQKRYVEGVRGQNGRRIIKAHTICNHCFGSIARKSKLAEAIVIYQCNHQYHASCLSEKQREQGAKKCPICLKHSYMAIREERERLEQRQRKRTGRRPGTSRKRGGQAAAVETEDEESDATATTSDFGNEYAEPEAPVLNSESLMMRKMEQYDGVLDEMCLGYSEFELAMNM